MAASDRRLGSQCERGTPEQARLDGRALAAVFAGAGVTASGWRNPQTINSAGDWSSPAFRRAAGEPGAARAQLRGAAENSAGHAADQPHRRNQHKQQLLSDLLCSRNHCRGLFRRLGDDSLDADRFGRLLLLPLSGAAGIRTGPRRRGRVDAAHSFLFPGGHGGQSVRHGE